MLIKMLFKYICIYIFTHIYTHEFRYFLNKINDTTIRLHIHLALNLFKCWMQYLMKMLMVLIGDSKLKPKKLNLKNTLNNLFVIKRREIKSIFIIIKSILKLLLLLLLLWLSLKNLKAHLCKLTPEKWILICKNSVSVKLRKL